MAKVKIKDVDRTFIPIKIETRQRFKVFCSKNNLTYDEAINKFMRGGK